MKSFEGTPINVEESMLCKVVDTSSQVIDTEATCLYSSEWPDDASRYSVVVLDSTAVCPDSTSIPAFKCSRNDFSLEAGDILLIEPSGLLTKLYERRSWTNSVLPTERCNCRCLMCPQPPRNDREDLVDLSLRTISLMDADTEVLGITGGEPTLVWDGLMRILSACSDFIPSASIQLLTNGRVLKNYAKAEELAEIGGSNLFVGVPLYADVSDIHDELMCAKGAFWDTIEGLYNLARAEVFVELRTVVTKHNYERLPQWCEYVYRTMPFVSHVAIMGMEPIGLALENIDQLWIDPVDYLFQLEEAVKVLKRRDVPVSIYNHQLCTLPKYLWPIAARSISEWKIVYMRECERCNVRSLCGGFFYSAEAYRSGHIAPVLS